MTHRRGITLVEVLVSIFIMAVGMICLLTLFPVGAISIAQALRDDRAAQAVSNATAYANAQDLRHDSTLTNPTTGQWAVQINNGLSKTGPSSPVCIDPFWLRPAGRSDLAGPPELRQSRGAAKLLVHAVGRSKL